MQRLRAFDVRISRFPTAMGLCKDDIARVYDYLNSAQRRLLFAPEAHDESWWGTWAEIGFNVSASAPYITMPREVARIEAVTVCDRPVSVQNQFYEYLQFGNGRLPKRFACAGRPIMEVLSRNNVPTFYDLADTPQYIVVYPTNQADVKKKVFIQGVDSNGVVVTSQDVFQTVKGIFVSLQFPFSNAPILFSSITGIQKDVTLGPVHFYQMDPISGAQTLLHTMEPSEQTAWYRRYYLNSIPCNGCCPGQPTPTPTSCNTVAVTAIVKLDLIPVMADTDYCLIQNLEALIQEAQSARYSVMDEPEAKQMEAYHHKQAVRLLNGEITHWIGQNTVAVNFAPFGSAHLSKQAIGTLR